MTAWRDLPVIALVVGGATGIAWLSRPMVAEADLVMIYLAAVALGAVWLHRFYASLAAVLAVVAFNFFFVPPINSFQVENLRYLVTFAVMAVAGVVVSSTATRLRDRARAEVERTQRMRVLLDVTRGLGSASTLDQVGEIGVRALSELTQAPVGLGLDTSDGYSAYGTPERIAALRERQDPAPGPRDQAHDILPVDSGARHLGEVSIAAGPWTESDATQQVVRAALALLGAAVERLMLDEAARAARVRAEVEQQRSDLLSAVSHDLRTPLGTIKGAATSLSRSWKQLQPEQRQGLLEDIDVEAERLGRMLANLLDISRLQGNDVALTGDWYPPEDVVGSALHAARSVLANREILTHQPEAVSLIWMDALLVEQALVNLLDNAARHAPSGPIEVRVDTDATGATFEVSDRGPGFGERDTERWFRRFERGENSEGSGLGLAITRAVVELHGGTISAGNRPDGGAWVRFSLPLGGPRNELPPTWDDAEKEADG